MSRLKTIERRRVARAMLLKYPQLSDELKERFRVIIARSHALELMQESLEQRLAKQADGSPASDHLASSPRQPDLPNEPES
jgi:hypothetical protein